MGEAGELPSTRTAHARHFAGLAIEAAPHLRGSDQLRWLARLRAERDNPVHDLAGAAREGSEPGDPWRALTMALEQIEDADLSGHPLLAAARPLLAVAVGRERVLDLLEGSARHPDPWVRATVPFVRVQLTENDGDLEGMRVALDEAIRAFGEVGDRWGLAATLSELAGLRILSGDLDGAESALEQTRSLMAELGAPGRRGAVRAPRRPGASAG